MKRMLLLFLLCFPFWSAHAQKEKDLKRNVARLEQELTQARDSLQQALDQCFSLSEQLERLDTLRKWAIRSMLEEYGDYPSLPFSEVTPAILDSLRYMGRHLSAPETDLLLSNLDTLERHLSVYRAGCAVLEQDYNPAALDSVAVLIGRASASCPSAQQGELVDLENRMRLYPTAVERAKIVAEWMDMTLKEFRDKGEDAETAVGLARSIFKDQDPEYQDFISKVPYMDRLYKAYMKAILETPLQIGPEERQLLSYEF